MRDCNLYYHNDCLCEDVKCYDEENGACKYMKLKDVCKECISKNNDEYSMKTCYDCKLV